MKYAVIDIGTNSCRLLIAEFADARIIPIFSTLVTTRLGESFKKGNSNIITPAAITRTCLALHNFKNKIKEYGVDQYQVIATSAVREAVNKEEFIRIVAEKCHLNIRVIDGWTEAQLNYAGVKAGLSLKESPFIVDLGGGSTEFIYENDFTLSIPLGAVKVWELNMSAVDIRQELHILAKKQVDLYLAPLVFVGGTATSLVAVRDALEVYDPRLIHGQILTHREITHLYDILSQTPLHLRKKIKGLPADRADIITGGVLMVLIIMDILDKGEIIVSENDLLEGAILELTNLG